MASSSATYRVRVLPEAHELEVELALAGLPPGPVRLEVPTWVPGAYGFMKYGRDLFDVRAFDPAGAALPVVREGWSGFRVDGTSGALTVRYRAGASDCAWGELAGIVGHDQAVLLGTRYLRAPAHPGPCRVRYELPAGWALHHPAGTRALGDGAWEYPSYEVLLDSPVVCGAFHRRTRRCRGVDFHHLFLDQAVGFDREVEGFLDAVMRVAEECHAVFGSFPFEHYTFIYSFNPLIHWGLEHTGATMVSLGEEPFVDPGARARGVRLCAHELFHAWNVCRLRPAPLGEPDLARGSFTDGLWVSEGVTRYYEFLLSVRAGEMTPEQLFSNVVSFYRHLADQPAYARASAVDSSRATFLNHNRYPGSINATIDYYDAGMLIAFDLDAQLRTASPASSLDRAFSDFYAQHAGTGPGFTQDDARRLFGDLTREAEQPASLSVLEQLVRLGFEIERQRVPTLGLVLHENAGPAVANVLDDGPAGRSGIAPGDEIVRMNGFPFHLKGLKWLIDREPRIALEVRRGHRFFAFEVEPAPRERVGALVWRGTAEQAAAIAAWMKCDFAPAPGQAMRLDSFENFHGIQSVL